MGTLLQMTWQLKQLKRRHGSAPLGLRNLGNTCYLNSVLQCLTFTPPLAAFCLRFLHSSTCDSVTGKENKGDCPFCILEKRISSSLRSDSACDAPLKLYNSLRLYAKHFRPGRQEDAHEFLRYVIDACHNTCLKLKKLQKLTCGVANGVSADVAGESVVKEIFGGALQSQVKCLSCGAESNKDDEIMDFSLDILHSKSLSETLQKFFQSEVLDDNNKYKCDNCKELVAARKQMSILEAPNVLVIQLKRFEGIFGGKIDKLITFDDTLDISSYMCKASQDPHPEYNLCGTIVHSGFSLESGHYYAYIKDAFDRWYCCNDSYVSLSTLKEVLSEKVYILFFSRTKQRPRSQISVVANGSKSHEPNGIKTSTVNGLGHSSTSMCIKDRPEPPSETKTFSPGPNPGNPAEKLVNVDDLSNHKSKMNGQNRDVLCSQPKKIGNGSTCKPLVNGSVKFSISKRKARDENIHSEPSLMPEKKEKVGCKESSNGVSKELANGVSKELVDGNNNKHGDIKAFSGNSGMKRKRANDQTCTLLAEDAKSLAEVEAFKESDPAEKLVNVNDLSNHKSKMNGQNRDVLCSQPKKIGNCSTCKPLVNGSVKFSISKRKARDENIHSELSLMLEKKEKFGCKESSNGVSKELANGVSKELADGNSNKHGDIKAFSGNSGMKRKRANDQTCNLLAEDAKSLAEVEAFKESIGKEASAELRSSRWYNEVHSFMHERKKMCQEANDANPDAHEMKSMLISLAKKSLISKIPESLRRSLIDRLRTFSQEKRPSGT